MGLWLLLLVYFPCAFACLLRWYLVAAKVEEQELDCDLCQEEKKRGKMIEERMKMDFVSVCLILSWLRLSFVCNNYNVQSVRFLFCSWLLHSFKCMHVCNHAWNGRQTPSKASGTFTDSFILFFENVFYYELSYKHLKASFIGLLLVIMFQFLLNFPAYAKNYV